MNRPIRLRPAVLALVACCAADAADGSAQASRSTARPSTTSTTTWRLVEELRYDPDGAAELSAPGQLVVSQSGELILHDVRNPRLVVFDAQGRFRQSLGRQGQGPGEFMQVEAHGFHGDTLWVTDGALGRVTYFGPDRKLLRTVNDRIAIERLFSRVPMAVLRGGAAYATPPVSSSSVRMRVNLDSFPVIYRAGGDGTVRTVAYVSHRHTMTMVTSGSGGKGPGIAFPQPLGRYPIVSARPDGRGVVVVSMTDARGGTSGRVQLAAFGPAGTADWRRDVTYPAEAVTNAQFDSTVNHFTGRMFQPGRPAPPGISPGMIRDSIHRPSSWAPFTLGFVDGDDRVWLLERPRGTGQRFRIFGAGGAPAGQAEAPAGVQVQFATRTHAWGFIEVDDEPVLVRYRLDPGGAPRDRR